MGVDFKEYVFESEKYYKISVFAGKAKSWHRCKVCGKTIKAITPIIGVHSFGELPTFFHPECAAKISKALDAAKQSLNADTKSKTIDQTGRVTNG